MSKKIQKRLLPVEDKLTIIKRINRGEKMGVLAVEFGIGRTTIHDIYKNRAKIQEYSEAKVFRITQRHSMRRGKYPRMEEALFEWYLQEKKTGVQITSTILITRAKEIHKEIFNTLDGFPTSDGWFTGFKRRYKILLTQQDDRLPLKDNDASEPSEMEEFKNSFFRKIIDLELCSSQVYVATENAICWRILPSDGFNNRAFTKDKINFLSCANASGLHKLKLLLVGNTAHELDNVNLPIHYFGQKISRMTEESFKTWVDECFVVETRSWLTEHNLPPKALLIIDQSLCNIGNTTEFITEDGCVSALVYPTELKNVMPLNKNIMNDVKQSYKRHLLLTASSRDAPMEECLRQFNIKDMVFDLAQSWQSVPSSKIALSWKTLWENMILDMENTINDNTDEQYDSALLRSVADDMLFPVDVLRKWFDGKDDCVHYNLNEIMLTNPDESNPIIPEISRKEAVKSFDTCIQWAEQNGSTHEEIATLRKIRDRALISKHTTLQGEFVDEAHVFDN